MANRYGRLVIKGKRSASVSEVREYLTAVEEAYNNLYVVDLIIADLRNEIQEIERGRAFRVARTDFLSQTGLDRGQKSPLPFIEEYLLPEDKLQLSSVVIESPGFWEFMGSLNPLQQIRNFINDHHERRQDREYREEREANRLDLENERKRVENERERIRNAKERTKAVRERVELLRELDIAEEKIRRIITQHIEGPLDEVEEFVSSGLIGESSVEEIENDEEL